MAGPIPERKDDPDRQEEELLRQITIKERRRLHARRTQSEQIWLGLGAFGIIGWSVAVPAVLGILLGLWLDARFPGKFSWTVAILFAGITLGCFNAWYWLSREHETIMQERESDDSE
jgi:ATP synthase protein I